MAEYRLDDLARVSGVSARNIRAYRERGLLDPPRRQGRAAFYDDYHLSQLKTINELLQRGFTSAHIAEFFERMREGHDLAPILGVQQAVLGRQSGEFRDDAVGVNLDPDSQVARRLLASGIAERRGDTVALVDPQLGEIITRTADSLHYIQTLLMVLDSTGATIDALAAMLVATIEESIAARYGPDHVLEQGEMGEVAGLIQDYRELGGAVVAHQLDRALQQHMVAAVSEYTTSMVTSREWEVRDS